MVLWTVFLGLGLLYKYEYYVSYLLYFARIIIIIIITFIIILYYH